MKRPASTASLDTTLETTTPAPTEVQLSLFNGWFAPGSEQSRTLDIFDAVSLFLKGKSGVTTSAEPITRTKLIGSHAVTIKLFPAAVQLPGKRAVLSFPTAREELVERTIRKLAVQQVAASSLHVGAQSRRQSIQVSFTLGQLRRELAARGHGYKLSEIKAALEILSRATLSITCDDNKKLHGISSPMFAEMRYLYDDEDTVGNVSYVVVRYHPLATQSILDASFFPINFTRVMRLKSPLARWLTERISHHYRQADRNACQALMQNKGYHISLSRLLEESGMQVETRLRDNIDQVRAALKQMQNEGVLHTVNAYTESAKTAPTAGRAKVVDMVWTLYLSQAFTDEILEGNATMKPVRDARRGKLERKPKTGGGN